MMTDTALEKRRAYAAVWRDNNREKYNEYHRKIQHRYNPRLNAISREAYKLAGGYNIYKKKTRDERLQLRRTAEARLFYEEDNIRKETEAEAWLRTIFPPQPYKESTVFRKGRTSKPGKDLKKTYNYTCQVAGCGETEVETAHIRKHSLHDSVDNETNMWCLCCNHHNAFDKSRMIVEDDGSFIRYKQDGTVCEHGFIVYDDSHKVDVTFIRKSREHHVRERQEMD
jgi:predicted restriction endonuclease